MRAFLYQDGAWCEQPAEEREHPRPRQLASRRTIGRLLHDGSHGSYIEALGRRGEPRTGPLAMPYLEHAQPLAPGSFPAHWRRPAYQAYLPDRQEGGQRLLICFAGIARTLNMPIPCFHSIANNVFDGIAYFFDRRKDYYVSIQDEVQKAIGSLLHFAPWSSVALLGTSGGASMVLRLPRCPMITRGLSASPSILRDAQVLGLIEGRDFSAFAASRIFFAAENKLDGRHYQHLKAHLPPAIFRKSVFDLSQASPSHGTLATLMQAGTLTDHLQWLADG